MQCRRRLRVEEKVQPEDTRSSRICKIYTDFCQPDKLDLTEFDKTLCFVVLHSKVSWIERRHLSNVRDGVVQHSLRVCIRAYSFHLRQGGYVFVVVCMFVCLLATSRKNFWTDLHEIFRQGWQWTNEQTRKFWWRYGSRIRLQIATLVRRALAEVWTVPVLLVVAVAARPIIWSLRG